MSYTCILFTIRYHGNVYFKNNLYYLCRFAAHRTTYSWVEIKLNISVQNISFVKPFEKYISKYTCTCISYKFIYRADSIIVAPYLDILRTTSLVACFYSVYDVSHHNEYFNQESHVIAICKPGAVGNMYYL